MADDIQFAPDPQDAALEQDIGALDAAIAQAHAELERLNADADTASQNNGTVAGGAFSAHEVPGIGRYVVPRYTGWKALHALIRDPVANIDYFEPDYPSFDNIITQHFNSPPFLDPADDEFDSYQNLRDNISAVRNFLMMSFYAPHSGMTPDKAKKALEEIAAFVGDGLYNNWQVTVLGLPILGYHDPLKPFLSLSAARAGNGKGAQYLYEKILEYQKRWDWSRPFDAIRQLFGLGERYNLPPANGTGFTDIFPKDITTQVIGNGNMAQVNSALMAAVAKVNALEAKRSQLNGVRELNQMADELEYIGDHLLQKATQLSGSESIAALAKPVKMDAIAEARKILDGLKKWVGDKNILDGLKLKPTEDMSTFHAVKGVTEVYSRLLAWARGVDATIMNHPGIQAATQAMGQLGYLAKLEALNFAKAAGNNARVQRLTDELKNVDARFAAATDATFGGLLGKLENGINLIIERVTAKDVPGAMVAHHAGNDLGSYMSSAPTAGMAQTLGGEAGNAVRDAVGKRNAELLMAEEAQLQAQASQIQHQNAARDRQQGNTQSTTPARPAPGRAAVQTARRQSTASSTTTSVNPNANIAQRQQQLLASQRNMLNAHHMHELEEQVHHAHDAQMAREQAMRNALKNMNMNKLQQSVSTKGLSTAQNPATMGKAAYQKYQADAAKANAANPDKPKELQPQPPKSQGRGF